MRVSEGGAPKPKAPTKELGFKKLDTNNDNKLSAEEMKDSKKFQGYDKNNNGEVTRDEAIMGARSKANEDKVKKALSKYDGNKDGNISGNEANKIKAFDTDKDGKITKEEIKAGKKAMDDDGDGKITQQEFQEGRKEIRKKTLDDKFEKAFAKLDKNKDDGLSGNEAKKYDKWDKDGDGKVTKEEFKAGKHEAHDMRQKEKRLAEDGVSTKQLEKRWDKIDKNDDGWLSGNENSKFREQFDRDGNGEITKEEFIDGKRELRKLKRQAELVGDDPSQVRLEKQEPPQPRRPGPQNTPV